ncbi:hypothetical protein PUN4_280099 [Paraburkholderia unamae]|nr:hypothetical protein PUN4_280099 [Paraburkholderia unamae]
MRAQLRPSIPRSFHRAACGSASSRAETAVGRNLPPLRKTRRFGKDVLVRWLAKPIARRRHGHPIWNPNDSGPL